MKKNILKYILVMFLAVSFVSCDDYDPDVNYYDTAKLSLSDTKFTVLDGELNTTIDFQTTTKTVTNVSVEVNGSEISTGTATNNKYAFVLNRSNFGTGGDTLGGSFKAYVYATVDGKKKELYTTFKMVSASSIRMPFIETEDEDGEDIEVDEPIYELSDVVKNFTFEVSPMTSTGYAVKAESKVGKAGTYTTIWDKAYDAEDLDIAFMGSTYSKGDTVFVKLTATAGTYTETVSSSIVISEYLLGAANSVKVDVAKPGYDLVGDSIIDVTETACNIEFTHDYANLEQGITGLNLTSFVLVDEDDDDMMAETNLPVLMAAFEAGTPVTAMANVMADEKYIVKHTRGTKVYYGTIVITGTNDVRDGDMDFVMMDSALEVYDVQK